MIFLHILVMTGEFSYRTMRCQVPSFHTEAKDVVTQMILCCSDYRKCARIRACAGLCEHPFCLVPRTSVSWCGTVRSQNSSLILQTTESSTCAFILLMLLRNHQHHIQCLMTCALAVKKQATHVTILYKKSIKILQKVLTSLAISMKVYSSQL